MKAIGIDIGTTSICGILIDVKSGEVLKSITKNCDAFLPGCANWEKIQDVNKKSPKKERISHYLIKILPSIIQNFHFV